MVRRQAQGSDRVVSFCPFPRQSLGSAPSGGAGFSDPPICPQLMFAIVVDGARPIIRAGVTPRLRGLVELCIYEKAEDRPSVAQILDLLEQDLDFLEAE